MIQQHSYHDIITLALGMISYMSTPWYHKWNHRLSSIHTKCKTWPYPHTSIDKLLSVTEIYIKTSINQEIIKNQLQNVIDMGSKQYLHWYHKHWYHKWYHRLSVHSALPPAAPDPACSLHRFLVSSALTLLSLTRSLLILPASAMDTIRGRPLP